ncbi:MAG: hypothetical protein AAF961_08530, partial [Planctomycetota bacterium]
PRQLTQLAALRGDRAAVIPANYSQLTSQITASLSIRPRAILFESYAGLTDGGASEKLRANALELTNLRLGLLDPWLASGMPASSARSLTTGMTGIVLRAERSHLILPAAWHDASPSPRSAAFLLPSVPETSEAYLITPAGSRRIRSKRVTGGVQITVVDLPHDAFLLLTEDGQAYAQVERRLRREAARAFRLRVEMVEIKLSQARRTLRLMPQALANDQQVTRSLQRAELMRGEARLLQTRADWMNAYVRAAACDELLDRLANELHRRISPSSAPGESAVAGAWSTLVDAVRVAHAASDRAAQRKAIAGGDFEDLGELLRAGWRRMNHQIDGIETAVRLSPESPANGDYCLELTAEPVSETGPAPLLPTSPVWITSPSITIPSGHLIEFSGMVRTSGSLAGPTDALLIFDSLGGADMAVRVRNAPVWEPFRLIRAAPDGDSTRLTLALNGVGSVQIDSIRMRFLPLSGAPRSPVERSAAGDRPVATSTERGSLPAPRGPGV